LMQEQERGITHSIDEIEEAIQTDLGWRLEALARATVTVRGGALADFPSFGKTVTTIGLITSEFEQMSCPNLLDENAKQSSTDNLPGLIETAATLIVCPPHIAVQWKDEFLKFWGEKECEKYDIRLLETYSELQDLTIEHIKASRVIILSWTVLADESYVSQLAQFAALPPPARNRGRAFDAWLDYVLDVIPARLVDLEAGTITNFNHDSARILESRLSRPEFQAEIPISIKHGSAYQSWNSMTEGTGRKAAKSKQAARLNIEHSGWTGVPLLQFFRFNRVVIDEYQYLNEKNKKKSAKPQGDNYPAYAALKKISSHKHWILSGTPALENFTDVNEIANFLGVTLGRDVFINGTASTPLERRRVVDQTGVERFLSRMDTMSYQWHLARHNRAQEFLDKFVRQNAPSLEHIDCIEALRPVELSVAHRAMYLELSQHCKFLRMRVKKLNNNSNSDRIGRFNKILDGSASAEEALMKTALLLQTEGLQSGISGLIQVRQNDLKKTEEEILKLMVDAKSFEKYHPDDEDHLGIFERDMRDSPGLGDPDANLRIRNTLRLAVKQGTHNVGRTTDYKKKLKYLASDLRVAGQELAIRTRSLRFIESIQQLLKRLSTGQKSIRGGCHSPGCPKAILNTSDFFLISSCGHIACKSCLQTRIDDESCVCKDCNVTIGTDSLIKVSDLGLARDEPTPKTFSKKLDSICELAKSIPLEDQAVVFVPNLQTMGILEDAFENHDITYYSIDGRQSSKKVTDFKKNRDPEKMRKVLILNLGDESASGLNLVNANHVIFVAPLLANSQHHYDQAILQAIARCRRYGQSKKVYIYHFVALRTIDVDILEQRHKRIEGICEYQFEYKTPNKMLSKQKALVELPTTNLEKREKTKLVRNAAGWMALVPMSWATDDVKLKSMEVLDKEESFTSLISFPEAFLDDEV